MSSQSDPKRVLFFCLHKVGVQTPENPELPLDKLTVSTLQSAPVVQSVNPHADCDKASVFLTPLFLGLLVKIAGFETTLLLINVKFAASSLVDHFFFWKEDILIGDSEENFKFFRSFTCLLLFEYAFITVRKNARTDFEVTYQTFGNPQRFVNPLNGAFPRADRDPEDDSGNHVELSPFCSPITLKDATDKSFTFKQLKVYIDRQKGFLFFFFTLITFDDDEIVLITSDDQIEDREEDDAKFKMVNFDLSFPIQFCGRSISSPIGFEYREEGDYIASFTIKIGNEDYNVRLYFGSYDRYFIDHHDSHYTLSAISDRNTCTTIFCGNTDAEVLMEREMSKVGILEIEIPHFVAPETDDNSGMVESLRNLPVDLQAFLTSITWRNPEAAGSN